MSNQPNCKAGSRLFTRREFVNGLALASAAFQVVPGSVLGLNGATPPSERLNLAGIGVGGQGGADLAQMSSENIVALCDVDWAHAAGTFKRYPQAKRYKDYRKMLDEMADRIDAVVVATPDHTHAFATMAALRLNKGVYCEKPLTHSVWEARQVAQMARQKKCRHPNGEPRPGFRTNPATLRAGLVRTDRPGARGAHLDGPTVPRLVP